MLIKEPGDRLQKLTADGSGRACFDYNGTKYHLPSAGLEQRVFLQYNRLARTNFVDFAAFKSVRRRKAFSQVRIEHQNPGDLGAKDNYHLRVWPLLPLPPGDYAGDGGRGDYVPDDRADNRSSIAPDFHHSLPRFVFWQGTGNAFERPANIQRTQNFLNLP
jgi:hypothetical protein